MFKNDAVSIYNTAVGFFCSPLRWQRRDYLKLILLSGLTALAMTIDESARTVVQSLHNPTADRIFDFGHWYGKPFLTLGAMFIVYAGGLLLGKASLRNIGLKIFEAFAFSGIVVTIVKSLFGRWRPYAEHGSMSFIFFTFGPNEHLSLPSGDVAVAFAFSTIIAGLSNDKRWKLSWYLFAIVTAIGRMYHDQHWFSDVFLAAGIALIVGYFINNKTYSHPI
jgi:membrane-associated phospholipid phosphatase